MNKHINKIQELFTRLFCSHNYSIDYIYITSSGVPETVLRCTKCHGVRIRESVMEDLKATKDIY